MAEFDPRYLDGLKLSAHGAFQMPRFVFNHTSRDDVSVDDSGTEFAKTEAMVREIRSNLMRLDAACSAHWPLAK
jgi:hypothetical protein